MVKRFLKIGCIAFCGLFAMNCEGMISSDISAQGEQQGSEQNAVDQMVQALLEKAKSDEYVRGVLNGPDQEEINENSERVRLVAQLLILLGKGPGDLQRTTIRCSIGIGAVRLRLSDSSTDVILNNVEMLRYGKKMTVAKNLYSRHIGDEFDISASTILRYGAEKSYFNTLRNADWTFLDEALDVSYKGLNPLMFLIASEGFMRVYKAYITDNPGEAGSFSPADMVDVFLSSWLKFFSVCDLVKDEAAEFQNYSALSIAVKRFAMLLLKGSSESSSIDEQVLMYLRLIRRLASSLAECSLANDLGNYSLIYHLLLNRVVEVTGNRGSSWMGFLKVSINNFGSFLNNEELKSFLKNLLNKAVNGQMSLNGFLKAVMEEKNLKDIGEAKQFVKNNLISHINETINGLSEVKDVDRLTNAYRALEQKVNGSNWLEEKLSEIFTEIVQQSGYARAQRCLKAKIPNFKSNDRERTSGEAYSDCLVWLVTEAWMKGKVSGDVLKQAFQLGRELQEKGIIDENVNNGFINQALRIIERKDWIGTYPRLATK